MGSEMMEIPDDLAFLEVLGATPEPSEYDADVWQVNVQTENSEPLTLTFDIGARSVRLTRGAVGEFDVEVYREQVGRLLLYSRGGERGIVVEVDVPSFKCDLVVAIFPRFRLVDPMLYIGN
ncbi:hypothetical protein ABZY03_00275 [Streptomyces klenkii]|uniref:hypothetical protein n=1 Tax=Streptomyces klenkii TaxID=1420899 RepID=UPI0033B767D6